MHPKSFHLFTPGPTPIPEFVRAKMSEPAIHHRKSEFIALFQQARDGLKYLFQTKQEVLMLTCCGTGAMEASITNLLSPGDRVITVNAGKFGERWADICRVYGVTPIEITKEWGTAVQPDEIVAALKASPEAKAVYLTYNETSTAVAIDLPAIARAIRENSSALIVVDCISALIALPLKMDEWGLDVVISGSQKGFMLPPGLAFVALSNRAWVAVQKSRIPKFYFSLQKALKSLETSTTPFTPASSLIVGLSVVVAYFKKQGLENIWNAHARHAAAVRAAVKCLQWRLVSEAPSAALTAVYIPEEIGCGPVITRLQEQHGIVVAGGQGPFKNKIIRIGHLGYYTAADILGFVGALEETAIYFGCPVKPGTALKAAQEILLARLWN